MSHASSILGTGTVLIRVLSGLNVLEVYAYDFRAARKYVAERVGSMMIGSMLYRALVPPGEYAAGIEERAETGYVRTASAPPFSIRAGETIVVERASMREFVA